MREGTCPPVARQRRRIPHEADRLIGEGGFRSLSMRDGCLWSAVPGLLRPAGPEDGLLPAVLDRRDAEAFRSPAARPGRRTSVMAGRKASTADTCDALVRRNATRPEMVRRFSVLQTGSLAPGHPAVGCCASRRRRVPAEFIARVSGRMPEPESFAPGGGVDGRCADGCVIRRGPR
ncbi:hypothetical protein GCM10027445_43840 [Amycolatopsis endophytica]|uniref:Uncharacterized protein n=1 Tax=Amycolatopsis endophytica TaxID=860233 RepID=A0A853BES2_9PSEU|nr:TetR/AcrR family transcriptional regulator [Amycolatopsis endophytica]NYI93254.1 hypothetical protein [Amycolatopsis endophytica]